MDGRKEAQRRRRGLDKALGRMAETAGKLQEDETLEVEGRAAQRLSARKTYFVTT